MGEVEDLLEHLNRETRDLAVSISSLTGILVGTIYTEEDLASMLRIMEDFDARESSNLHYGAGKIVGRLEALLGLIAEAKK